MRYEIEELSPVKRKITVTVPEEEVHAALAATVAMWRGKADVKGFRKGKVPSSVIESKFRKQIKHEATTDLINLHINQILGEADITPFSRIDVDSDELVRGEEFVYSFSFETTPEFDLPEYKGVAVEEEEAVADEAEIQKVEERILENLSKAEIIEEVRNPAAGDIITVNFGVYQGDELLDGIQGENFEMTLGEGQALPEFEELLLTLKQGESGEKEITFPEDFINTSLAGKSAVIKATLHAIKEKKAPELTDELAKKAGGFESVDQMREALRESYLASRKQLNRSDAQKKLLDKIMEGIDFALPESLVEDRTSRLVADLAAQMERRGKSLESLGKSLDELRAEYRPKAEELCRSEIVLISVAKREGLEVRPEEVDMVFKSMSERTGQSFHELKAYYEDNNLVIPLRDRLLADKAMEKIYQLAEVATVAPGGAKTGEKDGEGEKTES